MVATASLVEAEGRSLRRHVLRLTTAAAMVLIASLLGAVGVGFIMYGLFWVMSQQMPAPLAAGLFGLTAVALAGGLAWTAKRMIV